MKTARRVLVLLAAVSAVAASQVFTPTDLLSLRGVSAAEISPDGEWIAYTLSVPRGAAEPAGTAYSELHLVPVKGGGVSALHHGEGQRQQPEVAPGRERHRVHKPAG
jgi:hypothetical protein